MKSLLNFSLLAGLSSAAALATTPCAAQFQNTLSACSTATAFCTSLLGYVAGGNHTYTVYETSKGTTQITSTKTGGKKTLSLTTTVYITSTLTTQTSTTNVPTATVYS